MEIKRLRRKIILLTIGSFLISIAPIIIVVAIRMDVYVRHWGDVVMLTIGGMMVVALLILKAIGKLRLPARRVMLYGMFLIIAFFLQRVLQDLVLLLGMATLGEALDMLIFARPLRLAREQLQLEKTGDAVSKKVLNALKNSGGNP